MIVVCPNTVVSKLVFDWIAGREVEQADGTHAARARQPAAAQQRRRRRLDHAAAHDPRRLGAARVRRAARRATSSKDAAHEIDAFKQAYRARNPGADVDKLTDADLLREAMNTIGKKGKLGEHIRCVVSVSMLTEGWDANTVTHILGIRPFRSQLLCEQVVGRGLRRRSYAINEDTGHFEPEYAEVYGVPFAFIPSDQPVPKAKDPRPAIEVRALPRPVPTSRSASRSSTATASSCPTSRCDADFDERLEAAPRPASRSRSGSRTRASSAQRREVDLDDIRNARPQRVAFAIAKTLVTREEFFAAHRRRRAALAVPAARRRSADAGSTSA